MHTMFKGSPPYRRNCLLVLIFLTKMCWNTSEGSITTRYTNNTLQSYRKSIINRGVKRTEFKRKRRSFLSLTMSSDINFKSQTFREISKAELISYYTNIMSQSQLAIQKPDFHIEEIEYEKLDCLLRFAVSHSRSQAYSIGFNEIRKLSESELKDLFKIKKDTGICFITQLLVKPSHIDLVMYRLYPEIIGALVDILQKSNNLTEIDLSLIALHLIMIKKLVATEVKGFAAHNRPIMNHRSGFASNSSNEIVLNHLKEVYKMLNDCDSVVLDEIFLSLRTFQHNSKEDRVIRFIDSVRLIIFLVKPTSVRTITTFLKESKVLKRTTTTSNTTDCYFCCTMALTFGYVCDIILSALTSINLKHGFSFSSEFYIKYNNAVKQIDDLENGSSIILNINNIVDVIFEMLSKEGRRE